MGGVEMITFGGVHFWLCCHWVDVYLLKLIIAGEMYILFKAYYIECQGWREYVLFVSSYLLSGVWSLAFPRVFFSGLDVCLCLSFLARAFLFLVYCITFKPANGWMFHYANFPSAGCAHMWRDWLWKNYTGILLCYSHN